MTMKLVVLVFWSIFSIDFGSASPTDASSQANPINPETSTYVETTTYLGTTVTHLPTTASYLETSISPNTFTIYPGTTWTYDDGTTLAYLPSTEIFGTAITYSGISTESESTVIQSPTTSTYLGTTIYTETTSTTGSNQSTPAPAKSSQAGRIVGGVIGGIVGITLIASGAWYMAKRQRNKPGFQTAPIMLSPFDERRPIAIEIPEPPVARTKPVKRDTDW